MATELLTETPPERRAPRPESPRLEPPPRRRRLRLPPAFYTTWESLRIALSSLRANKLRTALTLVGVVVGVAAVIAVVTIIKGLDQTVASTFSSQGSTVFTVSKRPSVITSREDFIRFNRRKDVTQDDAESITRLCNLCWRTGIAVNAQTTIKAGNQSSSGARFSLIAFVQVPEEPQLAAAEDQARAIMRNRRGKSFGDEDDGFTLETQDVFIDLYKSATANIYVVTIGVAAISLVVGGIVVMNIMLVSVTERTREIGIRKAVGASRRDILLQFLIEAVVITSIGGLLGVGFGFALAFVLAKAMGFPLLFSAGSAILGVSVSSAVGIASGLWPAWKASKLDPIEALRAE